MKVGLGIGSYTFAWAVGVPGSMPARPLTAFDLLEKASGLGVRTVQICDNLGLERLADDELGRLARRAEELSIQVEVGTRGFARDRLERQLELAERFGSPILRVVVDSAGHRPSPEEVVGVARDLVPELERAGVCLAIENHERFRAAELAGIVTRVGSPRVGICLDTVNSFGALEGPGVVVEELGPFTVNLHVKEFRVARVPSMLGYTIGGAPVGKGQLDVPWLLKTLEAKLAPAGREVRTEVVPTLTAGREVRTEVVPTLAAGREMSAVIEQWVPPQDTVEQTIQLEEQWARESVEYLRGLIPD